MFLFKIIGSLAVLLGMSSCNERQSTPPVAEPITSSQPTTEAGAKLVSRSQTDAFFVKWFESHGETEIVVDAQGVGLKSKPQRLRASLYSSKQTPGKGFSAEMEFNVQLTPQRVITEFVAGLGDTEAAAIQDAQANFVLTTFHVIYKAFLNDQDPHMQLKPVVMQGISRSLISGNLIARGLPKDTQVDFAEAETGFESALLAQKLSQDPHWVKVVYGQQDGKPVILAVTVDNNEDPMLMSAAAKLPWPQVPGFYMAKQFLILK